MHLQQTTFENLVTQNEQFLLLPQCFQLFLIILLLFMEIFHVFVYKFSNSSAADLLYVGKGYGSVVFNCFHDLMVILKTSFCQCIYLIISHVTLSSYSYSLIKVVYIFFKFFMLIRKINDLHKNKYVEFN